MSYRLKEGENLISIDAESVQNLDLLYNNDGSIHLINNNQSFKANILDIDIISKSVTISLNGKEYTFKIEDQLDQLIDKMGLSNVENQVSKEVKAPMPGLILDIMVEKGQSVTQGESLLILEAMKMENVIKAEADGVIDDILLTKGDTVEKKSGHSCF